MTRQTKTDKAAQQIICRLGEISPEGLAAIIEAAQGLLDMVNIPQETSQNENDTRPAVAQRGCIEWKTIPHKTANGTQQYGCQCQKKSGSFSHLVMDSLRALDSKWTKSGGSEPQRMILP